MFRVRPLLAVVACLMTLLSSACAVTYDPERGQPGRDCWEFDLPADVQTKEQLLARIHFTTPPDIAGPIGAPVNGRQKWQVCYRLQANVKYHFGIEIKDPGLIQNLIHYFVPGGSSMPGLPASAPLPNAPAQQIDDATFPMLHVRNGPSLGRVLDVTNAGTVVTTTIISLQVALSATEIPTTSLSYNDPMLQALTWTTVISSSTAFGPGQTQTYAVTPSPPVGANFALARLQYTDPSASPYTAVYEMPPWIIYLPEIWR